jgi:hypothetical protein
MISFLSRMRLRRIPEKTKTAWPEREHPKTHRFYDKKKLHEAIHRSTDSISLKITWAEKRRT